MISIAAEFIIFCREYTKLYCAMRLSAIALTSFVLLAPVLIVGQETDPINSNYLIEHGVSPRILDAAASQLLQDGSYTQDILIESEADGEVKTYEMQIVYDPSYQEGMDVRMILEQENLSKQEIKYLKSLVENTHHFSRMSRKYLYDESTLRLVKNEGGEVAFEYYYQTQDLEPYLKHIKRLKGLIVFQDGELDRVELTNTKKLKGGVLKYKSTVRYEKTNEGGGHIVTSAAEEYEVKKGGTTTNYNVTGITSDYRDINGVVQSWNGKESISPLFANAEPDTISVKLGWFLPLLGKPATKLGYKLPRPVGLNIFSHYQRQDMQFTDLLVGVNDEEQVSFANLLDLENSQVTTQVLVAMVKADVWILPFLNIMGIYGSGTNDVNGTLLVGEELKQAIAEYGWLIGVDPEDLPDEIEIRSSLDSRMYGGGFTVAGGVGDWNLSLNYQLMFAEIADVNTTEKAHVITPMVGYMLPFDMNVMVGAQGQFYNTAIKGFIDIGDGDVLNFNVDFEPIRWNFLFGIYKGFAKHWEVALQGGVGARKSTTLVFGYRF